MHNQDECAAERSFLLSVTPSAEASPESTDAPPKFADPTASGDKSIQGKPSEPRGENRLAGTFLHSPSSSQSPSPIEKSAAAPIEEVQGRISGSYPATAPEQLSDIGSRPVGSKAMALEATQRGLSPQIKPFVGYGDLQSLKQRGDAKTKQDKSRNFSWKGARSSIANRPRTGSDSNWKSQIPVQTIQWTTAGTSTLTPRWARKTDAYNQFSEAPTNIPQLKRHAEWGDPREGQSNKPTRWPLQQIKNRPARNVVSMQGSSSMRNIATEAIENSTRDIIPAPGQSFQQVSSRLPRSHTLGNLLPGRHSQETSGSCPQDGLRMKEQPYSNSRSKCTEIAGRQTQEDIAVVLHKEKSFGEDPSVIKEPQKGQQNESETGKLNSHIADDIRTVTSAQPHEYWLGRLTTLVNAFQHEEGFNEPDPAIRYERSTPKREAARLLLTRNPEENRAKRALMMLQRYCKTSEAKASLDKFRESYSKSLGHGWPSWSNEPDTDEDVACNKAGRLEVEPDPTKKGTTNGKSHGSGRRTGGEFGVVNIFRSVRRSLG